MATANPQETAGYIRAFFSMAWAVLRGKYKFPWISVLSTLACLVYVVSPVDLLPDVLPLLGIADDGAFIVLVLALWKKDLSAYRNAVAQPKPDETVLDVEATRVERDEK